MQHALSTLIMAEGCLKVKCANHEGGDLSEHSAASEGVSGQSTSDAELCSRLQNMLQTIDIGAEAKLRLGQICQNPQQSNENEQDMCRNIRDAIEQTGTGSVDKSVYYQTCFPHNNYRAEGEGCHALRGEIVTHLNTDATHASGSTTLDMRFKQECQDTEDAPPPAGFHDAVLSGAILSIISNPFPDTNLKVTSGEAALELYRRNVIGGFPDGEFKGDNPVNRAEAAKFILLACARDTSGSGSIHLSDISDHAWYTPFVKAAADQGIIAGYPDGTFRPANTVNRAEFLKMLALGCDIGLNLPYHFTDVSSSDWFAPYAGAAATYDLYLDGGTGDLHPGDLQTRNETAVAIYQYLKNRPVTGSAAQGSSTSSGH